MRARCVLSGVLHQKRELKLLTNRCRFQEIGSQLEEALSQPAKLSQGSCLRGLQNSIPTWCALIRVPAFREFW